MRALWLNSGGPDCLVAMGLWREEQAEAAVLSCYVDLNSWNRRKAEPAAARNAELLEVEHTVLRAGLPDRMHDYGGFWHWPVQSILLFSLAAQEAAHYSCDRIVSGYKLATNAPSFPRSVQEAINGSSLTFGPSRGRAIPLLQLPLLEYPGSGLAAVVAEAQRLGLDLRHTWSCNRAPACGSCPKCEARRAAGLPVGE